MQQQGSNRSALLGWSFTVVAVAVQPESSAPVGFVLVRVREQQTGKVAISNASRIEIVLANGRTVRVAGDEATAGLLRPI